VLELHEASGLTVAAFCEQEGLKVPTFYVWRRKLLGEAAPSDGKNKAMRSGVRVSRSRMANGDGANGGSPQFDTIAVVDDSSSTMELQAHGAIIRLRETADDDTVRRLLAILREA
jgi:hypothetical protein